MNEQENPVLDAENPWPGLAPFDEAQADFFYGRQREVEDLFRRVRLNLLTVLYGQSGLGKTSLVRAALFPRLRGASLLPVGIRLDYSDGAPAARAQIWQALAAALEQAGVRAPALAEDQTLWEYFHQRSLAKTLVPVLVFDQFEELFTLGPERAGGSAFVRDCLVELAALSENRPPDRVEARFDREPQLVAQYDFDRQDYRVLLSLREDYLAHLHDLSGKIPSITLNNMRLTPLDGPRALEAVEKPGGRLVAAGAAEAIVRVVAGTRGERPARSMVGLLEATGEHRARAEQTPLESLVVDPSLLSLLCRELNQKRRVERLPSITAELVEANRENILSNFYERCLATLPEAVQIFVEEDLLTESGFRETLSVDNAEAKLRRRGGDPRTLTTLVNRRLLHFEQRGMLTRVELTHDVLAPVVRQSRTLRREREAIQETEARKRHELEENERLAQQARVEAEAKYERSKRQRRVIGLFGLAMAAVAAVAVYQKVKANEASRTIADQNSVLKSQQDSMLRQNQLLEEKQQALRVSTDTATMARRRADSLHAVADLALQGSAAMVDEFCAYTLKLINQFGDSTAGKPDLTAAYRLLVERSDEAVERMISHSGETACPRRLEARTESIATGLLVELQKNDSALARGYRALGAARRLTRWTDAVSRQEAAKSFFELSYNLWRVDANDSAAQAAREGILLAATVDPATDSSALDRLARTYHYGVLAVLDLSKNLSPSRRAAHLQEARRMAEAGLAAVQRGEARRDQNRADLLFTESQLWLRRGEVDSAAHDTVAALRSFRRAVAVARQRHDQLGFTSSMRWRAVIYTSFGGLALALRQLGEAATAYDSAFADWGAYQARNRQLGELDKVENGYEGLIAALLGKARSALAAQQREQAARWARAAADSGRAEVEIRSSTAARRALSRTYESAADILEDIGRRSSADSLALARVRADSVLLLREQTMADARNLDRSLIRIVGVLTRRAAADTAGKPAAEQLDVLHRQDQAIRRFRETMVWERRQAMALALGAARTRADSMRRLPGLRDSLAEALGNASWTQLLLDRPEQAAESAREGMSLSTVHSYILPNYFNALVLSGRDEEATAFFRAHAADSVETPKILFACAVVRDIRELHGRQSANERHVALVERLGTPYLQRCPFPKS